MIDESCLSNALSTTLASTDFREVGLRYEGKVRDNYTHGRRRYVVVTDRISAFDRVLGTIPFKGQILNQLAAWWFRQTSTIVPNHMISVPDANVLECVECEPLPVEFVVRAYLTGSTSTSMWTHYEAGSRTFCGYRLRDGMRKNQRLDAPLLTPAVKAPKGEHDVSVSREELIAQSRITAADFDDAAAKAMKLFAAGQAMCANRGLILVDTKYEFGKTAEGEIVVIDEIHTPDSSRFWLANTYEERFAKGVEPESFDKDFVRRYFIELGYRGDGPVPPLPDDIRIGAAKKYIAAFEQITGEAFVPDTTPPDSRVHDNIVKAQGKQESGSP